MRITTRSMHTTILANLNKINEDMYRINTQVSSGKQFSKISDDPVGVVTALGFRSNISLIEQYQENLTFGDKAITAAENALTQMKEIAMRAKTLALQLANGSMTAENRKNAAAEVQQLFEETILLGNTSVNGKYIFGGYRTTGYTEDEPTPFIQDARDGYFINGSRFPDNSNTRLTGTVPTGAAADITTGDLLINDIDVRATVGADIDITNAGVNGLNMAGAWNIAQAINNQKVISQTGVTDTLSSPYAGVAATGTDSATRVAFYLNGDLIDVTTNAGDTASDVADALVAAINAASTTITATKGNGANGGAANAIILTSDDGSDMTITGLNATEKEVSGLIDNKATEGVAAKLTTLYAGAAATAEGGNGGETMTQSINGISFNVVVANGATSAQVAQATVDAINAISDQTGVSAALGDGTNGGAVNAVVLHNTLAGDESDIVVGALVNANADTGLAAGSYSVTAGRNTGAISLSSTSAFSITSDNYTNDTVLNMLGLGGGLKGFADNAGDGVLRFGSALASGDLDINGIAITTAADGISDVYQDVSAAAKAEAINNATSQTGVSATVIPASITAVSAITSGVETTKLIANVQDTLAIGAGDLAINGVPTISNVAVIGAPTNGLNMQRASDLKTAVNEISGSTGVTASLRTLSTSGVAANRAAGVTEVTFTLNGVSISVNATGVTNGAVATAVAKAINAKTEQTGVIATTGSGVNGGILDSLVLYNRLEGDESAIVLSGLSAAETARTGLANVSQAADATHNTGTVAFSSNTAFQLSSPNNPTDDTILDQLELGGGESDTGIAGDTSTDGMLEYGSTPTYLGSGDLMINGVDIITPPISVMANDQSNTLIAAINAKTDQTGVKAGRDANGHLLLTAVDGRNLHLQTSAGGQVVTGLSPSGGPQDWVHFGQVRLWGGNEFFLESATPTVDAITDYETGFAALGLTGGEPLTGQTGDVADDGKLYVNKINAETGYVRYAGDRDNDFAIKVGQKSTITVAKNGEDSVMLSGIFNTLRNLQNFLNGSNYQTATSGFVATDTNALLNSGETGLELADELQDGSFRIEVTSHDTTPPSFHATTSIGIDIENDTLEDIAQRINGVPGLSAHWTEDGHLKIESDDPERFSFALKDDTSNFLRVAGLDEEGVQVNNVGKSIAELDATMQSLTDRISDFGARANRIVAQQQIYLNLGLATKENLSETEDTDLTKAVMEIKAKELAYQAALAAAAKTMQLSLVDFLR
ncbi:MAG: flagellin hook IN motif-containing protein [Thermodesulfobacteriota bacterium]